MKNLVFRVDSSLKIGSGHVMRCITLANNLKKKKLLNCTFITRAHEGNFNNIIKQNGFDVVYLPNENIDKSLDGYSDWLGTSQAQDAVQTLVALKGYGLESIDLLVVDHYSLDIQWEMAFRDTANKILVIDDLANREHYCDIILDQNLAPNYQTRYDNLTPVHSKKFLGISYCLLRDDFFNARSLIKVREELANILIFFGGVDKDNATLKLLFVLSEKLKVFESVNVIVGQANPFKSQIEEFCKPYNNCHYLEQVTNMAELFSKSDLAIGAGGATTGERIFLGLPSIVFSLADNQVAVSTYLHENQYITYLGDQEDIETSDIISELDKYINSPRLLKNQSMKLLDVGESQLSHLIQEIAYD